jgi:hypothetical protein
MLCVRCLTTDAEGPSLSRLLAADALAPGWPACVALRLQQKAAWPAACVSPSAHRPACYRPIFPPCLPPPLHTHTPQLAEGEPPRVNIASFRLLFMIVRDDPPQLEGGQWSTDFKDFVWQCLRKVRGRTPLPGGLRAAALRRLRQPACRGCSPARLWG